MTLKGNDFTFRANWNKWAVTSKSFIVGLALMKANHDLKIKPAQIHTGSNCCPTSQTSFRGSCRAEGVHKCSKGVFEAGHQSSVTGIKRDCVGGKVNCFSLLEPKQQDSKAVGWTPEQGHRMPHGLRGQPCSARPPRPLELEQCLVL